MLTGGEKRLTLYENVLESLRGKVQSGEWPKGAMIPREVDLCEHFGVSRSTVRTAMTKLVDEGLFTRVKGVGTYVSDEKHIEMMTIFIDSFANELEKRGMNTMTELLNFCTIPAIEEVNKALGLAHDARLLRVTRLRFAEKRFDHGPIVLTTSYFNARFMELFQSFDLERIPLRKVLKSLGYERKIFDKHLSAAALNDRECRLTGVPLGALAIRIQSVAMDANDQPLEYTISLYPQDKNVFELRVKI